MGDALGKLIVGLLAIALAIWLLSIAVVAGLYGLCLSVAGAIALGIHRLVCSSAVASAGTASLRVVDGPQGFDLEPDPAHVAKVAAALRSAAIVLACLATALAAVVFAPVVISGASQSPDDVDRIQAWIVAIGGGGLGVYATYWVAKRWTFNAEISEAAKVAAVDLTAPMRTAFSKLQTIEEGTNEAALLAGLVPPASFHAELVEIFAEAKDKILSGYQWSDDFASEVLKKAHFDSTQVAIISQSLDDLIGSYAETLDRIIESGHVSLLTKLDEIRNFIDSGVVQERITVRDYNWIQANLAGVHNSLDQVRAMLQTSTPGRGGTSQENIWEESAVLDGALALRRLNANPGDDPEIVRLLYLALVKAYNSDQGLVKNPRRFQQINDAYALAKSLGLSK